MALEMLSLIFMLTISLINRLVFAIMLVLTVLALAQPRAYAENKTVAADTDQDGTVDRIAHFDEAGNLSLLELDSDSDGKMDRFQHYASGEVTRVERDTDHDGSPDVRDYFENGRQCDKGGGTRLLACRSQILAWVLRTASTHDGRRARPRCSR